MDKGIAPPTVNDKATDENNFFSEKFKKWINAFFSYVTRYVSNMGITPASMTTAERDSITPKPGQIIFNTDIAQSQQYDGTTWKTIAYL